MKMMQQNYFQEDLIFPTGTCQICLVREKKKTTQKKPTTPATYRQLPAYYGCLTNSHSALENKLFIRLFLEMFGRTKQVLCCLCILTMLSVTSWLEPFFVCALKSDKTDILNDN